MKRPTFETVEKRKLETLLVIDKEGVITSGLVAKFPLHTPVVIASATKPAVLQDRLLTYAPFKNSMPKLPDAYYSHIFVVYNGEQEVLSLLPQVLAKARNDGSKLFFIIDIFFADPSFVQELVHDYRNAHAIIAGDLFGETVPVNTAKTIYRFFHEANTKGSIAVRGSGLTQSLPVFYSDAIDEIFRVSFGPKAAKIGFLFPKHPPTELSLARLFQTINPSLRIDFVEETVHVGEGLENSQKISHITSFGEYLLQGNYPLLRKIKEANLLQDEKEKEKKTLSSPSTHYRVKPKSKTLSFSMPYVLFFIAILLFAPFLITLLFGGLGFLGLVFAKDALLHTQFQKATQSASFAHAMFSASLGTNTIVSWQAGLIGLSSTTATLSRYLSLGENGSAALQNGVSAVESYLAVFDKKAKNPKAEFIDASNKLKKAIIVYEKIKAEQTIPGFSQFDGIVDLVGGTIDSYPLLLGFDRVQTYLVLFQNNMELRPGGGFIGSYGLLTFKNGSVSDFSLHDVYDADGQLTGHVEPPYLVRRHMGIVHLYLRDSNFSPDFPTAASTSANMLHLETRQNVDGVIAVDVFFVRTLVQAMGSVFVPDYNETVNANNFYLLTQTHVEKDFFPGSTQKKDFLRSLFAAMQLRLSDKNAIPYLSLGKLISTAISEKHLLFAFPDASMQHLFSINNMSSALLDTREISETTYNDFLGISEANIGTNKANAFVHRKVEQKTTMTEDGILQTTVVIRYKNDSDEWPGGNYKNYLRIITPKETLLTGITIDGVPQVVTPAITDYLLYERPDFTPPPGLEVETIMEHEKTISGFLATIPKGKFTTIAVSYTSPPPPEPRQNILYNLWYFKQPGTDVYPYSFVFSYPESFKPVRTSRGLTVLGNSVVLEKNLKIDEHFYIELSKQ